MPHPKPTSHHPERPQRLSWNSSESSKHCLHCLHCLHCFCCHSTKQTCHCLEVRDGPVFQGVPGERLASCWARRPQSMLSCQVKIVTRYTKVWATSTVSKCSKTQIGEHIASKIRFTLLCFNIDSAVGSKGGTFRRYMPTLPTLNSWAFMR